MIQFSFINGLSILSSPLKNKIVNRFNKINFNVKILYIIEGK